MDTKAVLEIVAKAAGLAATATFILSVTFDWGFLYALGLNFSVVPTTISDHVRSALTWIPIAIFGFFIGIAMEFFNQRVERGLTEEEIVNSSKNPARLKKWRDSPYFFIKLIFILTVILFVLLGDIFSHGMVISASVAWYVLSSWMENTPLIKIRRDPWAAAAFKWCPPVFLLIFFYGYSDAFKIANAPTPGTRIVYAGQAESKEVNILRLFENGVLSIDPSSNIISVTKWSEINKIEYLPSYSMSHGLIGDWLRGRFYKPADEIPSSQPRNTDHTESDRDSITPEAEKTD